MKKCCAKRGMRDGIFIGTHPLFPAPFSPPVLINGLPPQAVEALGQVARRVVLERAALAELSRL